MFRIQGRNFSTSAEHIAALLKVQRQMNLLVDNARWEDNIWYTKEIDTEKLFKSTVSPKWLMWGYKSNFRLSYHGTSLLLKCINALVCASPSKTQLPLLVPIIMRDTDSLRRHGQKQALFVTGLILTSENLWLHLGSVQLLHRFYLKVVVGLFRKVLIFGELISHHKHVPVLFYVATFPQLTQQCESDVDFMVFSHLVTLVRSSRDYFSSASLTVVDIQGFLCVAGCFRRQFDVFIAIVFNEKGFKWRMRDVCGLQSRFNYTLTTAICVRDIVCGASKLFWPRSHFHTHSDRSLLPPQSLHQLEELVSEDIYHCRGTKFKQNVWFLPHKRPVSNRLNANVTVMGFFNMECLVEAIINVSDFWHHYTFLICHCIYLLVVRVKKKFSVEWDLVESIVISQVVLSLRCIKVKLGKAITKASLLFLSMCSLELVTLVRYVLGTRGCQCSYVHHGYPVRWYLTSLCNGYLFLSSSHSCDMEIFTGDIEMCEFSHERSSSLGEERFSILLESHHLLCDQFKHNEYNSFCTLRLLGQPPRFEDESFSHPERLMQRIL